MLEILTVEIEIPTLESFSRFDFRNASQAEIETFVNNHMALGNPNFTPTTYV